MGALCAIPIVFTQVLPTARWKTVLAAPAPPPAFKPAVASTNTSPVSRRVFTLPSLRIFRGPLPPASEEHREAPAGIATSEFPDSSLGIPFGDGTRVDDMPAKPPAPPATIKHEVTGPVRMGGMVVNANLIHKVQPVYPVIARTSHIQGMVEFTAIISREGAIENLQLKRGHPLLVNAARDAVLQWRYRPTILNGQPVEVVTDIIVNFTLNE
jgi:protein TonB